MKLYLDTEHDTIMSDNHLMAEYARLKASGETEAETFDDYMTNCLDKDGTLEPIIYRNRDTNELLTESDMRALYNSYIDNGLIDDYGYWDFVDGATDVNGLFRRI